MSEETTGLPVSLRDPGRPVRSANLAKIYALEFLQIMFAEYPVRRWDPDSEKTGILITDKYAFNLAAVAKRPGIVVNRGPMRWTNSGGIGAIQERRLTDDKRVYSDLTEGVVNINFFARGAEAEELATLGFEWFTHFREALRTRSGGRSVLDLRGLFRVSSVSIGEEALVQSDSAPDLSVVPIVVRMMVQHRWSMIPRAGKLKNITFRIIGPFK